MTQTALIRAFLAALADGATLQAAAASALSRRSRARTESAPELLEHVRVLGLGAETSTAAVLAALGLAGRAAEVRAGLALRALGYARVRRGITGRGYVYRRPC
jgi:hypothetical protein